MHITANVNQATCCAWAPRVAANLKTPHHPKTTARSRILPFKAMETGEAASAVTTGKKDPAAATDVAAGVVNLVQRPATSGRGACPGGPQNALCSRLHLHGSFVLLARALAARRTAGAVGARGLRAAAQALQAEAVSRRLVPPLLNVIFVDLPALVAPRVLAGVDDGGRQTGRHRARHIVAEGQVAIPGVVGQSCPVDVAIPLRNVSGHVRHGVVHDDAT
mmetsp:Transcript_95004/g.283686  ORF Transcript_95004/g.283686 Transcript_95004/m.283686 type:complete len:220 (+) Transcript_95004:471-1130(+)